MKVLGITDEINTCDCCGRTNLKKTVALEFEAGGLVHYGSDCAANALYGSKGTTNRKLVESLAKANDYAKKWIAKYGTGNLKVLESIANHIRVHWCNAVVVNGELRIG